MDGHLLSQGWLPTRRKCTTIMGFGTYIKLTKLIISDNCHKWSPIIPRMVPHQPKDGHPPSGDKGHGWGLTIPWRATHHCKDGHHPSKIWLPAFQNLVTYFPNNGPKMIPKMVKHHPQQCNPPSKGLSPTNPRKAINHHQDGHPLSNDMVVHHPQCGHPTAVEYLIKSYNSRVTSYDQLLRLIK